LPQPVDQHFEQSLDELKTIESQAKEAKRGDAGQPAPKKGVKKPKGKKNGDE
jgi:hypothetical protein